jgi:hypothetical protein
MDEWGSSLVSSVTVLMSSMCFWISDHKVTSQSGSLCICFDTQQHAWQRPLCLPSLCRHTIVLTGRAQRPTVRRNHCSLGHFSRSALALCRSHVCLSLVHSCCCLQQLCGRLSGLENSNQETRQAAATGQGEGADMQRKLINSR